ncbi:MAG TPA: sodium/proline symporter [Oscillatoriales cyanobacterium M59_W2019_021]|nr:sodium/proline symporter [Oscillatoriales cyanobacterium M4454_W2019_049]HIK50617.1 sodium/proline symporter [Oscillatoriales cyanobacterium M59_W2019_021]
MTDRIFIAITFLGFLALFTGVGIYSASRKQETTTDYLLASRNVNPWLTSLSAMATGQSGLLFVGQVGFAYNIGVSAIWLTLGWAIGDYLAWWWVFRRLRERSAATSADTVSALLGGDRHPSRWITVTSALVTIAFLGAYAAAQLTAGSKALNVLFGWDDWVGILIGAVVVGLYCLSGGIRASIWTDAVQAIVMLGSLVLLLGVAIAAGGGVAALRSSLTAIDPALTNFNPPNLPWGFVPFLLGWIVAGFGVVGQPHILVRAMAIDSASHIGFARDLKLVLASISSVAAMSIGLCARVLLPNLTAADPELALPYLSLDLLPSVLVGLMLAGLFAATLSTADSQILSCSAALTQDIFPAAAHSYKWVKLGTLTVTAVVLAIALAGDASVFALITFSWSALASSLGPLLVLRVWQQPISTAVAMAMMASGMAMAFVWNRVFGWSSAMNEVLPGMLVGIAVYGIARLWGNFQSFR